MAGPGAGTAWGTCADSGLVVVVVVVVDVDLAGPLRWPSFISSSSLASRILSVSLLPADAVVVLTAALAVVAVVVVVVVVVVVLLVVVVAVKVLSRWSIVAPPPMGGRGGCRGCSLALATPMVCSRRDWRVTWSCMSGSQTTGTEGWFHGHCQGSAGQDKITRSTTRRRR